MNYSKSFKALSWPTAVLTHVIQQVNNDCRLCRYEKYLLIDYVYDNNQLSSFIIIYLLC